MATTPTRSTAASWKGGRTACRRFASTSPKTRRGSWSPMFVRWAALRPRTPRPAAPTVFIPANPRTCGTRAADVHRPGHAFGCRTAGAPHRGAVVADARGLRRSLCRCAGGDRLGALARAARSGGGAARPALAGTAGRRDGPCRSARRARLGPAPHRAHGGELRHGPRARPSRAAGPRDRGDRAPVVVGGALHEHRAFEYVRHGKRAPYTGGQAGAAAPALRRRDP